MTINQLTWASLYYALLTLAWAILFAVLTLLGLIMENSISVFECLAEYHRKGSLNIIDNGVGTFIVGACAFSGGGYACLYGQDCLLKWVNERLNKKRMALKSPEQPGVPEQSSVPASKPTIPAPLRSKINWQILSLLISLILVEIIKGLFPSWAHQCPK